MSNEFESFSDIANHSISDDIESFFIERSNEELLILEKVMQFVGRNGAIGAGFYLGKIDTIASSRGFCVGCGATHGPGEKGSTSDNSEQSLEPDEDMIDPDLVALLTEFRVVFVADGELDISVKCVDCGYVYPSLMDRMIKPPSSCPGCYIKSAQG